MFYNLLKRSRRRRKEDIPKMSLITHGNELFSKSCVNTGDKMVIEGKDTFIPDAKGTDATVNQFTDMKENVTDLVQKNKATISTSYRRTRITLLCMICLLYIKPSLASDEDKIELVTHMVENEDIFCMTYKQSIEYELCYVLLGNKSVSSDEDQKGLDLTLNSSKTHCIMCINHFHLESYIFNHLYADSFTERIVENEVFGDIVQDKLVEYIPNDFEANVEIFTVGHDIQCFTQLPILNDIVTTKQNGNITLTTRIVEYQKDDICFYNLTCNIEGTNYSIIHEIKNCRGETTDTTQVPSYSGVSGKSTITGNRTTTTPSNPGSESDKTMSTIEIIGTVVGIFIFIGIIILILWKCKVLEKIKQQCRSRKHSEVYDVYELQHTEGEEKPMHLSEPESEALSNTVRVSFLPLQNDVSTSISLDL